MRLLISLVLWLAAQLPAQVCTRPVVGGAGLPVRLELTSTVTYSDGYIADGNLLLPDADLDAPQSWDLETGHPEVVVAVLEGLGLRLIVRRP